MGSVTRWIDALKEGQDDGSRELWNRYFSRLAGFARKQMEVYGLGQAVTEGEDLALSAFFSLCQAAERGQFSKLNDRNDFWQLLILLTKRKSFRELERQRAQKRGGGEKPLSLAATNSEFAVMELEGNEPTPEFAVQLEEEFQLRLDQLGDDALRKVALLRMQGFANREIADQMSIKLRSVERKVKLIRDIWAQDLLDDG